MSTLQTLTGAWLHATLPPQKLNAVARVMLEMLLLLAGALTVALLAQIKIALPTTPVPITGQTLGVLVIGAAFGAKRATAAMLAYLLMGAGGLPFFAAVAGTATLGYLLAFVPAAALVGLLAERFGADQHLISALAVFTAGHLVIFAGGVTWLMAGLHLDGSTAWQAGVLPFLPGMAVKTAVATLVLPAIWRLMPR